MPNVPSHGLLIGAMHSIWGHPWMPPVAKTQPKREPVYMAHHTKANHRQMAVMVMSITADVLITLQFSTTDTFG